MINTKPLNGFWSSSHRITKLFQRGYLMNSNRTRTKWETTVNRKFFSQFPWPIQAWVLSFIYNEKLSISALPKREKIDAQTFCQFRSDKTNPLWKDCTIGPYEREKKKASFVFSKRHTVQTLPTDMCLFREFSRQLHDQSPTSHQGWHLAMRIALQSIPLKE